MVKTYHLIIDIIFFLHKLMTVILIKLKVELCVYLLNPLIGPTWTKINEIGSS